ncbi:platelet glycoprotein V isoform X1 [Panthera leo]|uniref:platelet glycoprotein V isoform X1 n=3 Tax=Panthera leo TaxID=9689 RepID=UPI001C6A316E|nr:platelet glycoprotein V isoform X1 [Panthera leo]
MSVVKGIRWWLLLFFTDFAVPFMTAGYSHPWVKARRSRLSSPWALLSDACETFLNVRRIIFISSIPPAAALADMLRSALLCAALGLLRAQPLPCPPACKCVFRDAAQCTGSSVARIAELGLPVNLTHILLFQMGRGTLQNHSFSGMTILQRLMLSDSHISAIAPGTFDDLIKLKTLRLSRNKITHLPGALLDKTVLLEQLFLDRNELKDIDQNMFQKLVNLQELFLNQNQLAFLPARLFTNLGNLKVLDLSRNNLTHLPRGLFGAQAKLEKLVLHSNQLVSLDSGLLSSLRALVELQLDRNRIRSIAPGAFDRLRSLSSLTLSRNHLEFLPPALFLYSHNLTFLTLFENPLEELPEVLFGELAGLQELWLNCTRLRTLPAAAFRNLSRLRAFGATLSPRLSALPEDAFRGLGELQVLALHSNSLAALPGGLLRGLGRLRRVSLSHNRLRALPRGLFRNLGSLEGVRLEHNLLETLPGDVFADLPRLAEVLLGHNPWRCDCDLGPFLAWLRRHPGLVGRAEPPRCRGPGPRAGLPLWALPDDDPECRSARGPPPRSAAAPAAPGHTASVPDSWKPRAPAQLVADGSRQDHSLFWGLYFLLLAAQAVVTGVIVFAMIKLGGLFRKLIRERASERAFV